MTEQGRSAVRVLLLARAGEARQRLEQALAEAGAELVQAIDPAAGDPDAALALRPAAVLVALEPAIEDALDRFDRLLSDPAVLVMFDEAEIAAQRDGWDAARWVRHLAAKLHGHQDVLPPGTESDDAVAPEADIGVTDAADAGAGAGVEAAGWMDAPGDAGQLAGSVAAAGLLPAEEMDWSASAEAYEEVSLDDDPALAELLASSAAARAATAQEDEPAAAADSPLDEDARALDVAADAADDGPAPEGRAAIEWSLSGLESSAADSGTAPRDDAAPGKPAIDPLSLGGSLSLAEDDGPIGVRDTSRAIDQEALESLESRISGLSLVDPDSYGHGPLRGAVLVEAGLGGPDAVRQLLGGLQHGFPRPVMIRLQLDGGRYDRLTQQMQRATGLPVELAVDDACAEAGTVYFLQPGTTLVADAAQLRFVADDGTRGAGYEALPAGDSALVFLSGADVSRVDAAMARAGQGALVIAQAPDTCYDGSAAIALVARGAVTAEPGDLAQALLDFWH